MATTDANAKTKTHLKIGQKIRVTAIDSNADVIDGLLIKLHNDTLHIGTGGQITLDSAFTKNSIMFNFPYPGAIYDGDTKTIHGTTEEGEIVTLPLTDINHITVTLIDKDDYVPTIFNVDMFRRRFQFGVEYPKQLQIPIDSVKHIEALSKGSPTLMAIGLAVGFAVGGISGWTFTDPSESPETNAMIWALVGSIFGAGAGQSVGGMDRWKKIPVENLRVDVGSVAGDAMGISVVVRF
jgi:hypothetical protein